MTAEQTGADLRAAAEVLRRDGWTQRAYHRLADETRICHCAEGAIQIAIGRHIDVRPDEHGLAGTDWNVNHDAPVERRYDGAEAALRAHIRHFAIPGWNDAPGRTAEEVIDALEAAAEAVQ